MIKIVIVEDQTMLRDSLAQTIDAQPDMEVVASLADAAFALDEVEKTGATCALLDVCTENDSSGIVAARRIKKSHPDVRVVIMTGMPEITFIEQARAAHVDSFVYKNVGTNDLLGIIRSTMEGYSTFPRAQQSIFSDAAALTDVGGRYPAPRVRDQDAQGNRARAFPVRGHGQAPHLRDSREDRLRQHPAPCGPCSLKRAHRPENAR